MPLAESQKVTRILGMDFESLQTYSNMFPEFKQLPESFDSAFDAQAMPRCEASCAG